jgi:hypothetical protein
MWLELLENWNPLVALFTCSAFLKPCFVLALRRPSTSRPSRRSLRTTFRRGDSAIGSRYSRSCLRPAPFPASSFGTGFGHFRFQPVAELVLATSVSGQLRNWFRQLPFPASCGTGSGHFRFRPVAELVPATSVSGQLRNWFRPLSFPASFGTGSGHFRFRPVSELVPATFVSGQLWNWLPS